MKDEYKCLLSDASVPQNTISKAELHYRGFYSDCSVKATRTTIFWGTLTSSVLKVTFLGDLMLTGLRLYCLVGPPFSSGPVDLN